LRGRRALVTGGRIKIGQVTALRLLRAGAEVLVTTRFSRDAAHRFAAEADSADWQDRLQIERLDFRLVPEVLQFIERIVDEMPSLDILVNNAAQSVRRPAEAYRELLAEEQAASGLIEANPSANGSVEVAAATSLAMLDSGDLLAAALPGPSRDRNGELLDRREENSWTARLEDVSPAELLEVLCVNSAAPFLLTAGLKPLFLRSPRADRYVINVCGRDGQFNRPGKSIYHPHVNASKAALNMLTRTSAADYAADRIYMNSVDTGWVTHEGAYSKRVRALDRGFAPPLDELDAAARICDPIACGVRGLPEFGKLFRHYRESAW
jgi:NAD(P)-dependent dehydrogenase (short-subunit alcohol dehydrogenase family)